MVCRAIIRSIRRWNRIQMMSRSRSRLRLPSACYCAKLIKSATKAELEELTTSKDPHADVTGGMGGKIDTIKNITKKGVDVVLLNGNKPDRLYNVLVGEDTTSTIIHGGKK